MKSLGVARLPVNSFCFNILFIVYSLALCYAHGTYLFLNKYLDMYVYVLACDYAIDEAVHDWIPSKREKYLTTSVYEALNLELDWILRTNNLEYLILICLDYCCLSRINKFIKENFPSAFYLHTRKTIMPFWAFCQRTGYNKPVLSVSQKLYTPSLHRGMKNKTAKLISICNCLRLKLTRVYNSLWRQCRRSPSPHRPIARRNNKAARCF